MNKNYEDLWNEYCDKKDKNPDQLLKIVSSIIGIALCIIILPIMIIIMTVYCIVCPISNEVSNIILMYKDNLLLKQHGIDKKIYSSERISLILKAIKAGYDTSYLEDRDFDDHQASLIISTYENNLDINEAINIIKILKK